MISRSKKLYKNSAYVVVFLVIVYAIIQPLFDEIFPGILTKSVSVYFLLILIITFIASFLFLTEEKLDEIVKLNTSMVNVDLDEAINIAASKLNNNIVEMKVFAFTTAVIHPIIRSAKFSIGNCKLMIHQFDVEQSTMVNAAYLNDHNDQIVTKWQSLQTDGIISKLDVVKYGHIPMDYFIIMDDKILIQGHYFYEDDSPYGNEYEKPLLITSDNIESHKFIVKSSKRFDNIWSYWNEKSGSL